MKYLDILSYSLLLLCIVLGGVAIYNLRFEMASQIVVILMLVVFYIIWGMVYHNLKRDLTPRLFKEYLVIGAIAVCAGLLVFLAA